MKDTLDEVKCAACVESKQSKALAIGKLVENFPHIKIEEEICGPIQT